MYLHKIENEFLQQGDLFNLQLLLIDRSERFSEKKDCYLLELIVWICSEWMSIFQSCSLLVLELVSLSRSTAAWRCDGFLFLVQR